MTSGTRFVILAAPRTGSNLLCTLLNSHPEVLCHHEIFNPNGIFFALQYRDGSLDLGTLDERDRDPFRFLQRVWEHAQGASCVGFKMTRGQNVDIMQAMIEDPAVRKILLYRRNRLKTFVSEQLARQTDRWEVYAREDLATDAPRLHVDVGAFREHCALNESFYRDIRQALQSSGPQLWFETAYEDILDPSEHVRLLMFLGARATHARLAQSSLKQSDTDLRSHIENFRELELALGDSEYLDELYDYKS
jgi:LPS sulfotransferase NodH